eukprot:Selendium_serpulae@DN5246_c0_g1_i4.p1
MGNRQPKESMARLAFLSLNSLDAAAFAAQHSFYTKTVGMELYKDFQLSEDRQKRWYRFADRPLSVMVELNIKKETNPITATLEDSFWKIGLALHDVDLAVKKFNQAGISVGPASQFKDVGYLTSLQDPSNCSIELLQHTFENKPKTQPKTANLPLGQDTGVGQITLRVFDIDGADRFYRDVLGMKKLNTQNINLSATREFDLYFYGYTNESPPVDRLEAVENREWLYQRPYTTIELQHWTKPSDKQYEQKENFNGVGIFATNDAIVALEAKTGNKAKHSEDYNRSVLTIPGHDGVPFLIMESD